MTYTTEIYNDYVLVRVYEGDSSGEVWKSFSVPYYDDWNEVEYIIESTLACFVNNEE